MFSLDIITDNAAFEVDPAAELARILRQIAERLELGVFIQGEGRWNVRDLNGNTIGKGNWK